VTHLERQMLAQIRSAALPEPVQEYRFNQPRSQHRFDFAWPDLMVAVEVEGGTWARGRHTRGKGFRADCEKYNAAAILGWTVIRVTSGMLNDNSAIGYVVDALGKEGE